MSGKLAQIPESTVWPRLAKEDWLGALGVFLVVFLSLSPVVVRFIFVSNARLALRISNGVALALLFLGGYSFGRFTNSKPWRAGLSVVIFGMRWSPSPSSLEDEAALWFAASSVSKPAYSWSQLLLFISLSAVIFCE